MCRSNRNRRQTGENAGLLSISQLHTCKDAMVDRLEINSPAPSTVIDLDGTYINGNTLKIYLLAGIRHLIAHGDCKRLAQLSIVLLKRKIGVISHSEMKNAVLSMFYTDNDVLSSFKKKH